MFGYIPGDGVKKDMKKAKKLISTAYLNGNKDAIDTLKNQAWKIPKPQKAIYLSE